jgi:flagellar biosynthesis/type III secretory pathway chaperone
MTSVARADVVIEERELELEKLAIAGLLELLNKEQSALAGNEVDALEALATEKLGRLAQLTRYSEQRNARLRAAGHSPDLAGMQAWLAARSDYPAIANAWARVGGLAREARDQNEINGFMVAMQLQRTQRQLAFLNRVASNEPIYASDGVARSAVRQRSLGEA